MTDDIRRHPNGCIDFDFYRAQGVAMRRHAMRQAGLPLVSAATAVMTGALGFATVIPSAGPDRLAVVSIKSRLAR